jgi:hypothetical protein
LELRPILYRGAPLPPDDPGDVNPVLVAAGEDLVHHQVFGAARIKRSPVDIPGGCALHGPFFEVKRAQGNVDRNLVVGCEQSDAMPLGELTCVVEPRGKPAEEPFDNGLLAAEFGQNGEVDVAGQQRAGARQCRPKG